MKIQNKLSKYKKSIIILIRFSIENDLEELLDYDKLHIVNLNNDQTIDLPKKRKYNKIIQNTKIA